MFSVAARAVVRGRCFARLVVFRPSGTGTHCICTQPHLSFVGRHICAHNTFMSWAQAESCPTPAAEISTSGMAWLWWATGCSEAEGSSRVFIGGGASFSKAPHLIEPGVGIGEALEVLRALGGVPREVARLRGRGRIVDAAALRVGRQNHCMTHCVSGLIGPSSMLTS